MSDFDSAASPNWEPRDIEDLLRSTIERARTDAAFREKALSDPQAAIMEQSAKPVPDGISVKFHDGKGALVNIILDEPVDEDEELSDSELEQVAGGARCAASCAASCAVTSTVSIGYPGVGAVGGCV